MALIIRTFDTDGFFQRLEYAIRNRRMEWELKGRHSLRLCEGPHCMPIVFELTVAKDTVLVTTPAASEGRFDQITYSAHLALLLEDLLANCSSSFESIRVTAAPVIFNGTTRWK